MEKERKGIFNGNTPQVAMLVRLAAVLVAITLVWADHKGDLKTYGVLFEQHVIQEEKDSTELKAEGCDPAKMIWTDVAVMHEQITHIQEDMTEQKAVSKQILEEIKALR